MIVTDFLYKIAILIQLKSRQVWTMHKKTINMNNKKGLSQSK